MKKFVSYFAVFLACVISVYPFTAGAWGFGDMDGTELIFDGTLPADVLSSVNGEETEYVSYGEGQWNRQQNISFVSASGVIELYRNPNLPFVKGHGLAIVSNFSVMDAHDGVDYFKLTVMGSSAEADIIKVFNDGTYTVTQTPFFGSCFEDDLDIVVNVGNFTQISLTGTLRVDVRSVFYEVAFNDGVTFTGQRTLNGTTAFIYTSEIVVPPTVDTVTVSTSVPAPYYPGTDVQLNAEVSGTGIVPGAPESTVYWYVHGNTSDDTYIDNDGLLTIANDETSTALEIEAISTYDTTKSATLELPITYPLEGVQIVPSGPQYLTESAKRREIQYDLFLPNGDPFDYQLIEWYAQASSGHESYFRIDDTGLLVIEPNAPAGSSCTIQFAYQSNPEELSPVGAIVKIVTQQEGIYDQLTPTPDQSDKADQMEDAIGDAAGKLENNNSSLEQLTPSRPQLSTDLQLDEENLLAVSPLVTNIWSINGVGRMIGIVIMVATVAYIFFGKRDG